MTFLKKLGTVLLRITEIVGGFGPIAFPGSASTVKTVISDITQIASVIVNVEAVGQALQLPGPSKLTASAPLVAQIILQSEFFTGKKIANEALFKDGITVIADGFARVLNSLHEGGIDSTSMKV